jgi:hypothetical protein
MHLPVDLAKARTVDKRVNIMTRQYHITWASVASPHDKLLFERFKSFSNEFQLKSTPIRYKDYKQRASDKLGHASESFRYKVYNKHFDLARAHGIHHRSHPTRKTLVP